MIKYYCDYCGVDVRSHELVSIGIPSGDKGCHGTAAIALCTRCREGMTALLRHEPTDWPRVANVIGDSGESDRLRARIAKLEGLLRIALDTRGDADVLRGRDGWIEHTVKGAAGCVYHALKRECRLCELLACAARIEDGEEQG